MWKGSIVLLTTRLVRSSHRYAMINLCLMVQSLFLLLQTEAVIQNEDFHPEGLTDSCFMFHDCQDLQLQGFNSSGLYRIWLQGAPVDVFCDMDTDGGGWTVFQRRGQFGNPKDYFFRKWDDYKRGFGILTEEFWLGNENLHKLTSQENWEIRIDLENVRGSKGFAKYKDFWIGAENKYYSLNLKMYSGNAGDAMHRHDSGKFSTENVDNDDWVQSCSRSNKGAWWYRACHSANLNALNHNGHHHSYSDGINWDLWMGEHESLSKVEMKIRPQNNVLN